MFLFLWQSTFRISDTGMNILFKFFSMILGLIAKLFHLPSLKSFVENLPIKVLSAEFYFHKPITVHLEIYLFYCFIHFLLYIGQY